MSDTLFGSDNSAGRRRAMLRTAMGPTIAAALADPVVIEIMVNPDGVLRLDRGCVALSALCYLKRGNPALTGWASHVPRLRR